MRATTRRVVLFYLKPDDSCELYDDESILSEQPEEESVLWVRLKRFHKLRRRRQEKEAWRGRHVAGGRTRGPRRVRAAHALAERSLARRARPHAASRRR